MKIALLVICWLLTGLGWLGPAQGARLVSTLSTDTVQITSSFTGQTLSLFGNIEPDAGSGQRFIEGPFHVVIVVVGPTMQRVARKKSNFFGLWINTEQVIFDDFPGYFRVLSSGRLADITDATTLAVEDILPEAQPRHSETAGWWDSMVFGRELVRLMGARNLFGVDENAVNFQSDTVYSARLTLPSDIPPGPYLARTFVFKNGQIIARHSEGFGVRKIGFERFLGTAARQYSLAYGIACVAIAIFVGWLGGIVFKR